MEVNGRKFTIGADPELFVGLNGKFVSGHDLIPGTKQEPFSVPDGAVQVDGMALEFNIDPCESAEEFKAKLQSVKNTLKGMIGDMDFLEDCSVTFDEQFLEGIPAKNKELGCEADFCGWTYNQVPKPDELKLMRTAGGHVHIGGFPTDDPYSKKHFYTCARLARILDSTIGVYSLLWDDDDERRKMYGRAGSFRPKPYGMEYRTLSNRWVFSEKLTQFVFEGVERALKLASQGFDPLESQPFIEDIINQSLRSHYFFEENVFAQELAA